MTSKALTDAASAMVHAGFTEQEHNGVALLWASPVLLRNAGQDAAAHALQRTEGDALWLVEYDLRTGRVLEAATDGSAMARRMLRLWDAPRNP